MSFDEWLDEQEGYATRRERLLEDVDFEAVMTGNASCRFMQKRMLVWLEAAYNKGFAQGKTSIQYFSPEPYVVPGPAPGPANISYFIPTIDLARKSEEGYNG